jgi:hypothetical protein
MINEQDPTDESDPEGLLLNIPHKCEDCGKKINPEYKKCYLCSLNKKGEQ